EDRYAQRLLKLVRKKERQEEDVVAAPAEDSEEPAPEMIDLMEVLKQSLRPARKSTRKRKTA
ncbi:MAG: hypothetical protein ACRENP_29635, partial [Longimicrobiales bacterium]